MGSFTVPRQSTVWVLSERHSIIRTRSVIYTHVQTSPSQLQPHRLLIYFRRSYFTSPARLYTGASDNTFGTDVRSLNRRPLIVLWSLEEDSGSCEAPYTPHHIWRLHCSWAETWRTTTTLPGIFLLLLRPSLIPLLRSRHIPQWKSPCM
jgi:hypothetical protein